MKHLLYLIFLLFNLTVYSQGVKILNQAELGKLPPGIKFTFIEPSTDLTNFKYVATLQGKDRIRKNNIEVLYFLIREKANKLGGNCFKVKSFITDEATDEIILILDAFYATDSLIDINRSNHERNVVFIFGNEKSDNKPVSLSINDQTVKIQPGTYYKIQLEEGVQTKVNKGGTIGTSVVLNYEKDKLPAFYTLSGFGFSDIQNQPPNGISFKGGDINRISNISLGLLITNLLKQGN